VPSECRVVTILGLSRDADRQNAAMLSGSKSSAILVEEERDTAYTSM